MSGGSRPLCLLLYCPPPSPQVCLPLHPSPHPPPSRCRWGPVGRCACSTQRTWPSYCPPPPPGADGGQWTGASALVRGPGGRRVLGHTGQEVRGGWEGLASAARLGVRDGGGGGGRGQHTALLTSLARKLCTVPPPCRFTIPTPRRVRGGGAGEEDGASTQHY